MLGKGSIGDLFGGKTAQDKAKPVIVPQATPEEEIQGTENLMAEVKGAEKPQRKSIKFKTAQGRAVEVDYITQGNENVEKALKQICEAIVNGEITPEAEA